MLRTQTYDIADEAGLQGHRKHHYALFIEQRFPDLEDPGYAREWADRFAKGLELYKADYVSQQILIETYPVGTSFVARVFSDGMLGAENDGVS